MKEDRNKKRFYENVFTIVKPKKEKNNAQDNKHTDNRQHKGSS